MEPQLHHPPEMAQPYLQPCSQYVSVLIGLLGLCATSLSCGLPSGYRTGSEDSPRWEGEVALATLCPYGTISETLPGPLRLEGCPLPGSVLKLEKVSGPILFSGDCREKILAIRTGDLSLDTLWQVTPDNQFDLGAGPVWIRLSHDQDGHQGCWTPARIRVRGALDCRDQDRMTLQFDELTLRLSSGEPLSLPAGLEGELCHLPSSCALTGSTRLGQCMLPSGPKFAFSF